jgi:hypothetical protein
MMFRYLQPDCQCLAHSCGLSELPFFAIYAPIKNTNLSLTELIRLKDLNLDTMLNEHFLTLYLAVRAFAATEPLAIPDKPQDREAVHDFVENHFVVLLRRCGWSQTQSLTANMSVQELFAFALRISEELYSEVIMFLKTFSSARPSAFKGPLCGYLDFLYPILRQMKKLPFMPDGPIFLMLDDADNLNKTQTVILNSWVSTRTTSDVSLKISTQLNYKTYRTLAGTAIATPHDYSEVNIATVYTSSRNRYQERVREIVRKRLSLAGIECTPESFFPPDREQEEEIDQIAETLKREWGTRGRGYRPSDDVVRYARPNYIASLKGTRKAGSKYSYAGFEQLVHVSSGLVRCFLEPASQMFAGQVSHNGGKPVKSISPSLQNDVARDESNNLLFEEFDKLASEAGHENEYYTRVKQLSNLVRSLGGTFHQILISNRSERRVISIALSEEPTLEIAAVLKLGVQQGYFHASSLGNKEGTGRTPLYVLTRRLAPSFTLDPFGFAGYLFVTNGFLRDAMSSPDVVKRIRETGVDSYFDSGQLELFK